MSRERERNRPGPRGGSTRGGPPKNVRSNQKCPILDSIMHKSSEPNIMRVLLFSDILLTVNLFTKKHPKFGALTLVPLIVSWIGVTVNWFKTETKEKNILKTLPLLLLQIYPQWRALRVLYYARIKKDPSWREKKEEFEGGISHLGKHCKER